MVKAEEDSILLRISSQDFTRLILPMIKDELDIKLFCLQRLEFLRDYSIEELIPITYHMVQKSYNLGDYLVDPTHPPETMQLISQGICDVVWISEQESKEGSTAMKTISNPFNKFNQDIHDIIVEMDVNARKLAFSINNEAGKTKGDKAEGLEGFDREKLSPKERDLHKQRSEFLGFDEPQKPGKESNMKLKGSTQLQGFRVQRLIKGDALTVRAMSDYSEESVDGGPQKTASLSGADLRIVASSACVKTYILDRSKIPFLPSEIRASFYLHAQQYFDYDMQIMEIDEQGFKEWEDKKVAYYEEFLSKRKEYIDNKNFKEFHRD